VKGKRGRILRSSNRTRRDKNERRKGKMYIGLVSDTVHTGK